MVLTNALRVRLLARLLTRAGDDTQKAAQVLVTRYGSAVDAILVDEASRCCDELTAQQKKLTSDLTAVTSDLAALG